MLVEVCELSKSFSRQDKRVEALADLSFNLVEGEFVSIVGPSGCGKTTFLHILGGFETADRGSLLLNGNAIAGPGRDRGMLFQEFALYPWRNVLGNVAWSLEIQRVPKKERHRIAEHYLEMVHLTSFRDHYPNELSGGMKQRVALARVLVLDPQILLMDEPLGALDSQTRELMQEELAEITEKSKKTVLLITHDLDEAIYLSDRVIVFTARPGRVKEDIRINLPRPRYLAMKKSPEYMKYRNQLWETLHDEVLHARRAMQATGR
jgi:NitT/TauT family transport system ATP-binding protein